MTQGIRFRPQVAQNTQQSPGLGCHQQVARFSVQCALGVVGGRVQALVVFDDFIIVVGRGSLLF
ncbi:hypothetical protein [Accumulibacter sp.]|uniref:hypothetical protein n=1 Tax=Accumulibacter sp. TaxID=2053492 RepID=UPI0028C4FDCB|nr:hypothetical protein [Accumulibacter sp.]